MPTKSLHALLGQWAVFSAPDNFYFGVRGVEGGGGEGGGWGWGGVVICILVPRGDSPLRTPNAHFYTHLHTLDGVPGGGTKIQKNMVSRAEPGRAEPNRAEPSRAGPGRAEPSRLEPSRAEPS